MTNKDIKIKFIDQLMSRSIWTKRVNEVQYLTRCPFCGDSSDPTHGHFYIKVDIDDNSPIVYNCFKCPAGGVVDKDVCERLDLADMGMLTDITILNKTSDKPDTKQVMGEKFVNFEYTIPKPIYNKKIEYIEKRLGIRITEEDAKAMKVIPSFYEFLNHNKITELTCSPFIAKLFEEKYVGFLSYGNSHILFRDITDTQDIAWVKYPITRKSAENRIFYSLSSQIDPFTEESITINLCEGVFDAIGIKHNLGFYKPNTITISVTGKYYEPIIRFLVGLGLFGNNVSINVFADNDKEFNKKNYSKFKDTDLDFYKKLFRNSKYLFKSVRVYYNILKKDVGVPLEEISLVSHKI